jgi:mannosyltransferase
MAGALLAWAAPRVSQLRNGTHRSSLRLLQPLILAGAGTLSAVLMLLWLGRPPLWLDETVSVEAAKLPTHDLAHYLATQESNMALYHGLLHGWLALGSGAGYARAMSVLFGLATLPFAYALARRLFDIRTAVITVVLLAGNVELVGHAREARGYSLAVFLVTVAGYLLVTAFETGSTRSRRLYPVVAALAVYAHMLAVLAILAQLTAVLVVAQRDRRRRLVLAGAMFGLLLLPLLVALIVNWQGAQIDWVTAPRPRQLPGLLLWFAGNRPALAVYALGALAALRAAVRERRFGVWRYGFLVAWAAAPPLIAFAASSAKPVYLYRYFLVCLPALALLVAAGLARIGRAWLVVPLVIAGAATSTWTTASCTPDCVIGHDDWRAAAAYVSDRVQPGDGVIFDPRELRTAFAYYLPPPHRPRLVYPESWLLAGGADEGAATLAVALQRARSAKRVWLVSWWQPTGGVPTALARARGRPAVRSFAGNVRVSLYSERR